MKLPRIQAAQFHWQRTQDSNPQAWRQVQDLVAGVRQGQDGALREYTQQFDGVTVGDGGFRVTESQLQAAWDNLPPHLAEALQRAANRIRRFHVQQSPKDFTIRGEMGELLGMTWRPLRRVGVYAPGGRAAYPSTVLMNVIPAQVAGVTEIVLCSPPQRDTGWPHPLVLAAAHLTGVTEVYRLGGAQAVAALAYGTPSVPRVDKVVGPGNLYVALAKKVVMGDVGIDSIAGPSEIFIVADQTADPRYIAADMLAQAEHDPEAGAVCVLLEPSLADAVEAELNTQLAALPRRETATAALTRWGALVIAETLAEALAVVNESAPEHLELLVADPQAALSGVYCAGAVFLGPEAPEPVGDYYAGPNHVLPTHGSARFASGLGVLDFLRRMTHVSYTTQALQAHATDIIALAEAEGLVAHAQSVRVRLQTAVLPWISVVEPPVSTVVTGEPAFYAHVERQTGETSVSLSLNLHGEGKADLQFPVPFLRHMLHLFAVHGQFNLTVQADGDVDVDDHHLVEDIGLCLGQALLLALGNKRGIARYGERHTPMDETLARAVIDLSGRPALVWLGDIPDLRMGSFPTELVQEFFKSFANEGKLALHLAILYGDNSHHMAEALFKATGAALREAVVVVGNQVPSSKGVLA